MFHLLCNHHFLTRAINTTWDGPYIVCLSRFPQQFEWRSLLEQFQQCEPKLMLDHIAATITLDTTYAFIPLVALLTSTPLK
jgi:hypothetical protein